MGEINMLATSITDELVNSPSAAIAAAQIRLHVKPPVNSEPSIMFAYISSTGSRPVG